MPKVVLQRLTLGYIVQKIDVEDTANLSSVADIKLTTAAAVELKKKVPKQLYDGVKKSWRKMLQELMKKVQERSPVGYRLVRVSACLSPMNLGTLNQDSSQKMFDATASIMYNHKRISSNDSNKAKKQFDKFLSTEVKINESEFQ